MPKRKKVEYSQDEENEKEEKYEEVWDIRKIIAGVIILFILIVGGVFAKKLYFHESLAPSSFVPTFPSVKGITTNPDEQTKITHVKISLPTQDDVQNQIKNIQNQVTHLDLKEIATSSPQVQEVLQQIQNLPNAGTNQAKEACMRLCNNL